MKTTRILGRFLTLAILGFSSITAQAEDIDIYTNNSGSGGVPNVLLVLDNAANFSAEASGCNYVFADGVADPEVPTLSGTAGGVEQCAIHNVVKTLLEGSVNLGVMVYNDNNIRDVDPATGLPYDSTHCGASVGGCLIYPITPMKGGDKTRFLNWVRTWRTSGGAGAGYIKAASEATGQAMQESWAYYAGRIGLSGRDYSAIKPGVGCQKNFVIFIGNAFNSSGTPGDGGNVSLSAALAAAPGVTAEQKVNIKIASQTIGVPGASCGAYTMPTHSESSGLYADEWARYMAQTDIYGELDDNQNILTYAIGLIGPSCKPDYPALLKSMAENGRGKSFLVSNYSGIADALYKVLNEIQAVNSVFSSASLPVNANAQGTYENQIFLGMFRPDGSGEPRWLGNLKQYQFILEYPDPNNPDPNTATLKLGDKLGNDAISYAGTGFITPTAVSFWTEKDVATEPDASGGFFRKDPHGAGGAYESPDGELVEKGGAAQQLRLENLTADFGATAGTSSNPRRLYTYCPSGTACVNELTDSSNAFSVENTGIAAEAFGGSVTLPISSIVRTGTTALVTTVGNHGFSVGTQVTISNASQNEYNVTQAITTPLTLNTFTITGLPDNPTTPSKGEYTIATLGATSYTVTSMSRTSSTTGGKASETVTVQTTGHAFTTGDTVHIDGAVPTAYNGDWQVNVVDSTTFTYTIPIAPTSPAKNEYIAYIKPYSVPVDSISTAGVVTTTADHGFHTGQRVQIQGSKVQAFNGDMWTIVVTGQRTFSIPTSSVKACTAASGCTGVTTNPAPYGVLVQNPNLTRAGTVDITSATITLSSAYANWFFNGKPVTVRKYSGTAPNEGGYEVTDAQISCTGSCTSFSYTIKATPSTSITGTITASEPGLSSAVISAGNITRNGATATVTLAAADANKFLPGQEVSISPLGTSYASEQAYTGKWTLSCDTNPCSTTLTFGPVNLTPQTPATGANMQVFSSTTPPDKNTLIRWVRGEDNLGDEKGPESDKPLLADRTVKVRPSIHGDVLHSRPLVVNYGDATRGIVVFYGANDGVFRAVNGSQTNSVGSVPPGGELWGLVMPEHFGQLNRQRTNSPELKVAGTILPSAQPKDYFVDGSASTYVQVNSAGVITKAYLYLNYRRGGRFVMALDVTQPLQPKFLWRRSASDDGFAELGQTWSRPRVTLVKGYTETVDINGVSVTRMRPVLVFGAGYDTAEDAEPPKVDTSGRGIFMLDAQNGDLIWKATYTDGTASCTGTGTNVACGVPGMKWAIPSDVMFMDRDNNFSTERMYVGDLGGNVWRVDLESTAGYAPENWKVTKLAALGCASGTCALPSTTVSPRKFFYPPSVLTSGVAGAAGSYDAVLIGSGDREHPLESDDDWSAFAVENKMYMLKDTATGKDPGNTVLTEAALFDATNVAYAGSGSGYYVKLLEGEKVVNAPMTKRGITFFGTNRPKAPDANSCRSNLGEARGYALDAFNALYTWDVFDGGGLPPTAVAGVVNISVPQADGTSKIVKKEFCMGCGGAGGGVGGRLEAKRAITGTKTQEEYDEEWQQCIATPQNCKIARDIPKNLRRTYWYKK